MKKIDFDKLQKERIAVLFDTREEMKEFLKECEKENITWGHGGNATSKDYFDECEEFCIDIDYFISEGILSYSSKRYYESEEYKVINYKSLINAFTKSDLKEGDICTLRSGEKEVLISGNFTEYDIDNFNDDLTDIDCDKEYDIVKVERPVKLETVFEREEEPTEMTIEEIEEKLGLEKGSLIVKGVNE